MTEQVRSEPVEKQSDHSFLSLLTHPPSMVPRESLGQWVSVYVLGTGPCFPIMKHLGDGLFFFDLSYEHN